MKIVLVIIATLQLQGCVVTGGIEADGKSTVARLGFSHEWQPKPKAKPNKEVVKLEKE